MTTRRWNHRSRAWESVRRHFRNLGLDVQSDDLTVVGIATCRGMCSATGCCSRRTSSSWAPSTTIMSSSIPPDPVASFAERRRLFDLPASSWRDYDPAAISEGGGVFARSAKRILLSHRCAKRSTSKRRLSHRMS